MYKNRRNYNWKDWIIYICIEKYNKNIKSEFATFTIANRLCFEIEMYLRHTILVSIERYLEGI